MSTWFNNSKRVFLPPQRIDIAWLMSKSWQLKRRMQVSGKGKIVWPAVCPKVWQLKRRLLVSRRGNIACPYVQKIGNSRGGCKLLAKGVLPDHTSSSLASQSALQVTNKEKYCVAVCPKVWQLR